MKISPLTILVCGFSLMLVFLSYGFFMKWSPEMTETKLNQDMLVQVQDQANLLKKAEARKAQAKQMVIAAAQQWQSIVALKAPPKGVENGGIDLSVNPYQLTLDTPRFRNSIQAAVNKQMLSGGVKVLSGPNIQGPDPNAPANSLLASFYNYPTLPFPVVVFDLGTVTVTGTMKQIFENVRSWSRMPHYLAVADGLRLSGTSPLLIGTYQVTIVGYIKGSTIAGPVPEGSAASANTSPFGGGGAVGPGGPGRGGRPGGPAGGG